MSWFDDLAEADGEFHARTRVSVDARCTDGEDIEILNQVPDHGMIRVSTQ